MIAAQDPADAILCPRCGSQQLHAEKRGWTAKTGFFGSSTIILTCLKCGYQFRPGETTLRTGPEPAARVLFWMVVLIVAVGLAWLIWGA